MTIELSEDTDVAREARRRLFEIFVFYEQTLRDPLIPGGLAEVRSKGVPWGYVSSKAQTLPAALASSSCS